jgi:hypothetical protein
VSICYKTWLPLLSPSTPTFNCNINHDDFVTNTLISNYRLTLIKRLDATTCYAQALSKPTVELPLGLLSLQHLPTVEDSSILAYWFGR